MKRAFFGGVHPKGYKELSREAAIVPLHPSVVSVAMSQHIGAPCQPLVKVGDRVTVGQKIGDSQGLCVPVHASVSGTVTAIEARPHPGGNLQTAIVIESDGRDTLCPTVKPRDPEAVAAMSAEDLIAVIREAGITGMGGAGFPTSVKLSSGLGKVDTVIVNGAECEPYITSDDRLMRETPERVVGGLRVVLQILQPKRAAIGIEQNKPEAIAAISAVLGSGIDLLPLHVRYPQGAEKQLIQTVTGRCVPPGGLPAHVGCAVFNAATCAAIYDAVYLGLPLVRRDVPTNSWYFESIDRAVSLDLLKGVGDFAYEPDGGLNRAMFVTMLARAVGESLPDSAAGFSDVKGGQWYTAAMSWALRKNLIRGYEDGSYRPEALITREEMCVILDRLMQQRGETLHTGKLSFADTASISVWARDSVARMTALGLIRGAENNRFFPQRTTTRAEAATVMLRIYDHLH